MALPQAFLDEIRHRVPLHSLIGRGTRLTKSGRHWKGCCPFHNEKSPSFYVYDDHFHCFGCGAHGDAVSFVMQSGASFVDAVAQLAAEAGLEMPKPDPKDEPPDRIKVLYEIMEAVRGLYASSLFSSAGKPALDYLRKRGINDDSVAQFSLGYADDRHGGIQAALKSHNWPMHAFRDGGLLRDSDDGRVRDFFFRRLMFPIGDRKGRPISFGGRILGDGQPKYLNGPETPLFSKRRNLYGLDVARNAIRQGAPLMVVEGYLDVISLAQAGLPGAVAPLGTALTAEQLEEMWRLSPEPVLCFDGDAAGQKAAQRAVEVALPLITPQRSLSVVVLPTGDDPDTLVQRGGGDAMRECLSRKQNLSAFVFDTLRSDAVLESPEGKARFRQALLDAAEKIADKNLASEYRRDLLDRAYQAQRGDWQKKQQTTRQPSANRRGRFQQPAVIVGPRPTLDGAEAVAQRYRIMMVILLRHPALLTEVEEELMRIPLPSPLETLRNAMLDWTSSASTLDSEGLFNHLRGKGLDRAADELLAGMKASGCLPPCCRDDATKQEALNEWRHFFQLTNSLEAELEAAYRAVLEAPTAEAIQRLTALRAAQLEMMGGAEDAAAED